MTYTSVVDGDLATPAKFNAWFTELDRAGVNVFNVKHPTYGAIGDGVADDTAAIQAAIAAAAAVTSGDNPFGQGGMVFFPPGIYGVTSDIDIPILVKLIGSGVRTTTIRWLSGTHTNAVVTSNPGNTNSFVHGSGIRDLTIDANGQANGLLIRSWNEGCFLERVGVREFATVGIKLAAGIDGTFTNTTKNMQCKSLWLFAKGGAAAGLRLDGVRNCVFEGVTVDVVTGEASPCTVGIELVENCWVNTFWSVHMEDCTRGVDIGTTGTSIGNVFVAPEFASPDQTPASTTLTNTTGLTAFVVRSAAGADWGQIIGIRDSYGYAYVYADDALGISVAGAGGGGGGTSVSEMVGPSSGLYQTAQVGSHKQFADSDGTPDVSGGNVFSSAPTSATITNFDGTPTGASQTITIRFVNSSTDLTFGASTLQLAGGVDWTTSTANDTITLVKIGTIWYETGRSVN